MSLKSGLNKLSGLTFTELSVRGLSTGIGIKEVRWMIEHWPKLRILDGLGGDEDSEGGGTMGWLQKNYSLIKV